MTTDNTRRDESSKPEADRSPGGSSSSRGELGRRPTAERDNATHWLVGVLGLWLFLVPLIDLAGLGDTGVWNHYLTGLVIAGVAISALAAPRRWQLWAYLLLGAWAFIAPFALGFWQVGWSLWNHLFVGAVVGGLGLWKIARHQYADQHPTTAY